ncbi:MAG: diaminopimelate decarboxylase family protein [Candidatus Methylomirabilales bacterium]
MPWSRSVLRFPPRRRILLASRPFRYRHGRFWIEGVPWEGVAESLGTPVLIYSRERLLSNIASLEKTVKALPIPVRIHAALKACTLPGIATILREAGLGVEVMSEFEYRLSCRAGFTPSQVVVNAPAKEAKFLSRVVAEKVALVNVESEEELRALDALGRTLGAPVPVGVRVNPPIKPEGSATFGGRGSKFGFDVTSGDARRAVKLAASLPGVDLMAIHCHAWTRQYSPRRYLTGVRPVLRFLAEVEREIDRRIPWIDLGGGFGSRNLLEASGRRIADFLGPLGEEIRGLGGHRELLLEPGRYLLNDAAVCIGQVLTRKRNAGRHWVLTDAGSHILPLRDNVEYYAAPAQLNRGSQRFCIGDALCIPSGILPGSFALGEIRSGDSLVIFNCGAYTFSLAQHFGGLAPAVVLVEGNRWRLLFRRRSPDEWLRWIEDEGP